MKCQLERRLRHAGHAVMHPGGAGPMGTVLAASRCSMHDEPGSLLVALKMDVHWLGKRIDARAELQSQCQGMGTLVDKVGRIITDLRPSILDHQGLWPRSNGRRRNSSTASSWPATCSCTWRPT
jgi:hypothetical protein